MKENKIRNFTIVSLLLSAISISISVFRAEQIQLDGANLLGWLVGILAILVTVLIGWQIFASIEINKKLDEIRHAKEEIAFNQSVLSCSMYGAMADFHYTRKEELAQYLKYSLLSIVHASNINDIDLCNSVVKVVIEVCDLKTAELSKFDKELIIGLFPKIKNTERIKNLSALISLISRINEIQKP